MWPDKPIREQNSGYSEKKSGKRAWIIKKNLHICGALSF
nr:MAG TPA: hypothetical protein [Caudoviricetes sp.]DAZ11433.1 MAG TPA: hypothetical protein [Caudoviricetes sp.]